MVNFHPRDDVTESNETFEKKLKFKKLPAIFLGAREKREGECE